MVRVNVRKFTNRNRLLIYPEQSNRRFSVANYHTATMVHFPLQCTHFMCVWSRCLGICGSGGQLQNDDVLT